nr:esterase-like activity of phytase family protein [Sphingomicrobium nitratireducens]
MAAWPFLRERPDFKGVSPSSFEVELRSFDPGPAPSGWTLHGAWKIGAKADPRLVGLSGMDWDDGDLVMVSDIGAMVRMKTPAAGDRTAIARALTLGRGPGARGTADAEGVVREGGRWRVAVEQSHGANLYRDDGSLVATMRLGRPPWRPNRGFEAIAMVGGAPLLLGESGRVGAIRVGERWRRVKVTGATGPVTGAATLGNGRLLLLQRHLGVRGFSSSLALGRVDGDTVRVERIVPLATPSNANMEGIAVEPLAHGHLRLWLVSDDNGLAALASVLIAWDVEARALEGAPHRSAD